MVTPKEDVESSNLERSQNAADTVEGASRDSAGLEDWDEICRRLTAVECAEDDIDLPEGEQHSCEDVDCLWPCSHHFHETDTRDCTLYVEHLDDGCPYCLLLLGISRSYCACRSNIGRQMDDGIHEAVAFHILYSNELVVQLRLFSSCGGLDLELGTLVAGGVKPNAILPVPLIEGGIHVDRSSTEAIELFSHWLSRCQELHPFCEVTHRQAFPRRILNCGNPSTVKLCPFPETSAPNYVALSYCWGGHASLQLDQSTLPRFMQGVPLETLPKLFQDAVSFARLMGVQYVWIDSLCILQDSNKDKDHEISKMDAIYAMAWFVLAAASSRSPREGFLQMQTLRWQPNSRFRFIWRSPRLTHPTALDLDGIRFRERLHIKGSTRDSCEHENIGRRAWTYQERLLARRCFVFRERETVFECRSACWCECSGSGESGHAHFKTQLLSPPTRIDTTSKHGVDTLETTKAFFSKERDAFNFWKAAISAYSPRQMTKVGDRLPAISALAVIIHQRTGDEYLAGLWKRDLLSQLMWFNWPTYEFVVAPYEIGDYVAPSWSWASVPVGTFYYITPLDEYESYCASVEDVSCTLAGTNPFGAVSDGYLELIGIHCSANALVTKSPSTGMPHIKLILENRLIHEADGDHSGEFSFLDGLRVSSKLVQTGSGEPKKILQRLQASTETEQETCSGRVRLLWIVDDTCLILTDSDRVQGAYERIGILGSNMAPPMPDYTPSEIKLV